MKQVDQNALGGYIGQTIFKIVWEQVIWFREMFWSSMKVKSMVFVSYRLFNAQKPITGQNELLRENGLRECKTSENLIFYGRQRWNYKVHEKLRSNKPIILINAWTGQNLVKR